MGKPAFFDTEKNKSREKLFSAASLAVFAAGTIFFFATSYQCFFKNTSPHIYVNIGEKITESSLIKPQAPEKKDVEPPKTAETAELQDMLKTQTSVNDAPAEPPVVKQETAEAAVPAPPAETAAEPVPAPQPVAAAETIEPPPAAAEKTAFVPTEESVAKAENDVKQQETAVVAAETAPQPAARPETPPPSVAETAASLENIPTSAPLPDLIGNKALMETLPRFGTIKAGVPAFNPLPAVEPKEFMIDKNGLPAIGADEKKVRHVPFDEYKRPFTFPEKAPKNIPIVAVLFSGAGMRENATSSLTNALAPTVSLSFSPYAADLKKSLETARQVGHETFLDFPIQKGVFPAADPGPDGLVAGLPVEENKSRLTSVMARPVAYIGMVGTAYETFSKQSDQMPELIKQIEKSGLVYIDSAETPVAAQSKSVFAPDVLIFKNFYRSAIRQELKRAKQIAMEKGSVFIHAASVPIVILSVHDWMHELDRPFDSENPPEVLFVPVSYLLEQRMKK